MRTHRFLWIVGLFLMTCLVGCDLGKEGGLSIDLSKFDMKTGIIAALLLWVDKSSIWKAIATPLQPLVEMLKKFSLIPKPTKPDATPGILTSAELMAIIADLINRTKDPAIKEQLLDVLPTVMKSEVPANG